VTRGSPADIPADPFGERASRSVRWTTCVLGAQFTFSSNSRALLAVAREAFAEVPQFRWPRPATRALRVDLMLARDAPTPAWSRPPKPALSSGSGLLCGHVDSRNFTVIDPRSGRALVQAGEAMLAHRQLLRYELIEFAAITLATRVQGLVPLHAGCVGRRGKGVLLLGSSGTGKSTLTLHAALAGLDFLAEDSVFVQPTTLRAAGLSTFVHAGESSIGLIAEPGVREALRRSPCIERRSGARKREFDLRGGTARLARGPLRIVATVVLSAAHARGRQQLMPLTEAQLRRALRTEQPYAAGQPGWREFERRVLRAQAFRLDRMPPAAGVSELEKLVDLA
jgi:hypothetical protein